MCETAAAANRSLYDAVGLANSSLKYRCASPTDGPMRRERTSGVFPSPRVMRACSGTKSSLSAQRQMLIETLVVYESEAGKLLESSISIRYSAPPYMSDNSI